VTDVSGWNTHTVLRTPAIGVLCRSIWIQFNSPPRSTGERCYSQATAPVIIRLNSGLAGI